MLNKKNVTQKKNNINIYHYVTFTQEEDKIRRFTATTISVLNYNGCITKNIV